VKGSVFSKNGTVRLKFGPLVEIELTPDEALKVSAALTITAYRLEGVDEQIIGRLLSDIYSQTGWK